MLSCSGVFGGSGNRASAWGFGRIGVGPGSGGRTAGGHTFGSGARSGPGGGGFIGSGHRRGIGGFGSGHRSGRYTYGSGS